MSGSDPGESGVRPLGPREPTTCFDQGRLVPGAGAFGAGAFAPGYRAPGRRAPERPGSAGQRHRGRRLAGGARRVLRRTHRRRPLECAVEARVVHLPVVLLPKRPLHRQRHLHELGALLRQAVEVSLDARAGEPLLVAVGLGAVLSDAGAMPSCAHACEMALTNALRRFPNSAVSTWIFALSACLSRSCSGRAA